MWNRAHNSRIKRQKFLLLVVKCFVPVWWVCRNESTIFDMNSGTRKIVNSIQRRIIAGTILPLHSYRKIVTEMSTWRVKDDKRNSFNRYFKIYLTFYFHQLLNFYRNKSKLPGLVLRQLVSTLSAACLSRKQTAVI